MKLGADQDSLENTTLDLIASDNARPLETEQFYRGSIIQEGLVGRRPFAGAQFQDELESTAAELARRIFHAEHANLQPHSCSQANQAVYHSLLQPGDSVLAFGFSAGGHLTHGLPNNFSGRSYTFNFYSVNQEGLINYEEAHATAARFQPKLIICGSSSYPRLFDVAKLREVAASVGARLMLDLSHEAGLIAAGVIPNPIPYADVVTMSVDKTLRGPFGGLILCKGDLARAIDRGVHPGTQSSFPFRRIVDTAAALLQSQTPAFTEYANRVLESARVLQQELLSRGTRLVTGGTDKHYVVVDVKASYGLTGTEAEQRLEEIGILASRQTIPGDASNRFKDSGGIRLGTPWATSRGYQSVEFRAIAKYIVDALSNCDSGLKHHLKERISRLISAERLGDVWMDHKSAQRLEEPLL